MRVIVSTVCVIIGLSTAGFAMDHDVVVSVYQGPCKDGDFSANLAVARQVVKDALDRGSDFVVLPETFLSGYDSAEHVKQGARKLDDPELKAFIEETVTNKIVVLVGLARLTDEGIYNAVLVIHQGKLLGYYDKIMLTEGDRDDLKFLRGKDVPVFSANGVKFAAIICHDSSFPQLALMAKLQGAEILFTPHFNTIGAQRMDDHRKWVHNCHIGLATMMKLVVVRSNVVVTDKKSGLGYGDSFIMSPQGEILAQAELFKTEMITAKITPAMFKSPVVWADLKEVPPEINAKLAKMLAPDAKEEEKK
jgi:(R)-amidase